VTRGRRSDVPGTPARPLRVLVLDHTGALGGAELALVRTCEALGPDVDVRVLLFADGPLRDRLESLGVRVEVLPLDPDLNELDRATVARAAPAHAKSVARLLAFEVRLARRVRELRPDVVHTTSLKADLLGIVPARVARRPLVWHVHDRISEDYLARHLVTAVRALSRLADAVVVNSRATAATLPGPVTIAYPGFTPDQATGEAVHRAPRPPVVGLVGRYAPTKGQLELVRAAATVLERHPEARFRFVGAPFFGAEGYVESVCAEARRLGVDEAVTWTGFAEDPRAEIDGLTVLVHASPVPEPFGQVVVEAMVRGVPVVATAAGGVPEILDPDGAVTDVPAPGTVHESDLGLLVAPGDVAGLAAAVVAVLDDPVAAGRRADRAHLSATTRFSVASTAGTLSDVWERVTAGVR